MCVCVVPLDKGLCVVSLDQVLCVACCSTSQGVVFVLFHWTRGRRGGVLVHLTKDGVLVQLKDDVLVQLTKDGVLVHLTKNGVLVHLTKDSVNRRWCLYCSSCQRTV